MYLPPIPREQGRSPDRKRGRNIVGLNIYGKYTDEMETKIIARLKRAGFEIEDGGVVMTLSYLQFSGDERYPRALAIAARGCGMKPTMRFSIGYGHYGTSSQD